MKSLRVKTKKIEELSLRDKIQMWNLYKQYYSHSTKDKFNADLKEKSHCYIGYDEDIEVKGFSLFKFYDTDYKGEKVSILYTGDTMFHPDYWGAKSLHIAFITFCVKQMILHPRKKIYWHLISSGCRTYMSMARSTAKYYPNYKEETPSWEKGLIDHITSFQFKNEYNKDTGLIEFDCENEGVFKSDIAPIDDKALRIDEIRFFAQKNPRYMEGVELSCIAKIGVETFFFVMNKIISKKILFIKKRLFSNQDSQLEERRYV